MIGLAHVLLPLAIASGAHAEATPARTSLVYERTLPSLRELISGPNARPAQRGMLIVEPSADTAYGPARRSAGRVAKVSGGDLAGKSALEIAATLRNAIVNGCVVDGRDFGCASHVVVVDEIDARFDDGPVPKALKRHTSGAAGPRGGRASPRRRPSRRSTREARPRGSRRR